ncbi:MAG TPA: hydrolase TatD, partial [Clostridiales bacterium]|nr:hydrolase TatD [Clostridiales bacterium]
YEKVVAIGEIGLDYHYDFSPRDVQKKVLDIQFQIARETKKPVVIHDREAHGDCMTFVRK